jgi:hypothetical protein
VTGIRIVLESPRMMRKLRLEVLVEVVATDTEHRHHLAGLEAASFRQVSPRRSR